MTNDDSIDLWIQKLNAGDVVAAERIFLAYEPMLRIAIRRRISRKLRAKVDSKDVLQSVFADFLGGFRTAGWRFEGRPQVLAMLRRIAWRRLSDHARKHKISLDREQSLDDAGTQGVAQSDLPRPSEVAQGREMWDRLMDACPEGHREILRLKLSGMKLAEIAEKTGLHEGSVRRILYELARRMAIRRKTIGGGTSDDLEE